MSARWRATVGIVLATGWASAWLSAQAPPGQGAGPQAPPPADGGRGRVGAPAGTGRQGGFTQYTRPIATPEVLIRGKALYDNNCASCHAGDLRGTADGKYPNLLRSGIALRDQRGELIGASVRGHRPAINLVETDTVALAEYIHGVHATMGGQGSPPGRNPTNVTLNVLVGDAVAGEAAFTARCGACHSVTGNLRGVAGKFADPRALQNGWVSGSTSAFGGGGRGGGGAGQPVTVTMPGGSKLEGTLVRADDFLVVLNLPDGTRRSMTRTDGMRVEIRDPKAPHVEAIVKLAHDDTTSKIMHDITAYLWTIK